MRNIKKKYQPKTVRIPGSSDGKESAGNAGHSGSIPGLGRSPGEENGSPVQIELSNWHFYISRKVSYDGFLSWYWQKSWLRREEIFIFLYFIFNIWCHFLIHNSMISVFISQHFCSKSYFAIIIMLLISL